MALKATKPHPGNLPSGHLKAHANAKRASASSFALRQRWCAKATHLTLFGGVNCICLKSHIPFDK